MVALELARSSPGLMSLKHSFDLLSLDYTHRWILASTTQTPKSVAPPVLEAVLLTAPPVLEGTGRPPHPHHPRHGHPCWLDGKCPGRVCQHEGQLVCT